MSIATLPHPVIRVIHGNLIDLFWGDEGWPNHVRLKLRREKGQIVDVWSVTKTNVSKDVLLQTVRITKHGYAG